MDSTGQVRSSSFSRDAGDHLPLTHFVNCASFGSVVLAGVSIVLLHTRSASSALTPLVLCACAPCRPTASPQSFLVSTGILACRTYLNRYNKVAQGAQGLLVEGERHMHVDWRPVSQAPPIDTLLTSPLEAVHLRVMLNPDSIGHFLRDNLLPLVSVPLSFGEDPRTFVWLQVRCCLSILRVSTQWWVFVF